MNTVNVMDLDGEQIDGTIADIIKDSCEIVIWLNGDDSILDKNKNSQINIYLIEDEEIKELNKKHRGIDRPTDVLSFPLDINDPQTGEHILGELLISKQRAKEQADLIGHSYEREVAFLCVHGMLHLLGYDHETKKDEDLMILKQQDAVCMIEGDILDQEKLIKKIIKKLDRSKENAYAPYSGICVSAAAVADDGRVFYGVNIENSSYGATVCAERNAVGQAVAAGVYRFKMFVIASNLDELIYPCGICRQVIGEFALPWTKIIATKPDGQYISYRYDELMPHGFEIKNRRKP